MDTTAIINTPIIPTIDSSITNIGVYLVNTDNYSGF